MVGQASAAGDARLGHRVGAGEPGGDDEAAPAVGEEAQRLHLATGTGPESWRPGGGSSGGGRRIVAKEEAQGAGMVQAVWGRRFRRIHNRTVHVQSRILLLPLGSPILEPNFHLQTKNNNLTVLLTSSKWKPIINRRKEKVLM